MSVCVCVCGVFVYMSVFICVCVPVCLHVCGMFVCVCLCVWRRACLFVCVAKIHSVTFLHKSWQMGGERVQLQNTKGNWSIRGHIYLCQEQPEFMNPEIYASARRGRKRQAFFATQEEKKLKGN